MGGLTDKLGVHAVVSKESVSDHLGLSLVHDVAATLDELSLDLIVDGVDDDKTLLGGADETVIEGLGHEDGVDSHLDIGGLVDDSGGVTGATGDSRLAGGVSGVDHA